MDVMMPEMGRNDTRHSSAQSIRSLPMIALTAKAMKGDRQK